MRKPVTAAAAIVSRRSLLSSAAAAAFSGAVCQSHTREGARSMQDGPSNAAHPLESAMAPHVESGEVPGLVALVDRRSGTDVTVLGARSLGGPAMTRDTIFRIASLTKPVTAAAAMMLVEDGVVGLDDPVDHLLPELAEPSRSGQPGRGARRYPAGPVVDHAAGPALPALRPRCHHGVAEPASRSSSPWRSAGSRRVRTCSSPTLRTNICAGLASCPSCTSPARGGSTTPAWPWRACCWPVRPARASVPCSPSASSSRWACATAASSCRPTRSKGLPPSIGRITSGLSGGRRRGRGRTVLRASGFRGRQWRPGVDGRRLSRLLPNVARGWLA
jgi:hypothetical protein